MDTSVCTNYFKSRKKINSASGLILFIDFGFILFSFSHRQLERICLKWNNSCWFGPIIPTLFCLLMTVYMTDNGPVLGFIFPVYARSPTWSCEVLTSAACCRLSATCAAMTRWRSTTSRQQAHRQSLQRQKRLWPFKHETTPWFRQRAHLGLRVILRGFCWCPSGDRDPWSSPPSPRHPHCPAHPSGLVTSTAFSTTSDFKAQNFAEVSSCRPPSNWEDI